MNAIETGNEQRWDAVHQLEAEVRNLDKAIVKIGEEIGKLNGTLADPRARARFSGERLLRMQIADLTISLHPSADSSLSKVVQAKQRLSKLRSAAKTILAKLRLR